MEKVRVMLFKVGENPEVGYVAPDLKEWEEFCGGTIGLHPIGGGLSLVVNNKAQILNLPKNYVMHYNKGRQVVLLGNFFVHSYNEFGETADLSDEEIELIKGHFTKATESDRDII